MATSKKPAPVQEPEVNVQEPEVNAETPNAEVAKEDAVKVYVFKSKNPYLSCADLGVQFIDGKATTTKLEVARALAKVYGVELVED